MEYLCTLEIIADTQTAFSCLNYLRDIYGSHDHSDSNNIMKLKSVPSGGGYTESPNLWRAPAANQWQSW